MLHVLAWDRDGDRAVTPGDWVVERYARHLHGGPKWCEISVTGNELDIATIFEMLRYRVEVLDGAGMSVWWGYVSEVELQIGAISIGATLEEMANDVRVTYRAPGQEEALTSAATDAQSVAAFGTRERIERATNGETSQAAAEQLRDTILAQRAYPLPIATVLGSQTAVRATVSCRGWWSTLGWEYLDPLGSVVFENERGTWFHVDGDTGAGTAQAAQSFVAAHDGTTHALAFRVRKEGAPVDDLEVAIQADSSGAPSGTDLDSATVATSDLSDEFDWVTAGLTDAGTLADGATYWIVWRRSGASDTTNYYALNTNDEGLGTGTLAGYDGTTWTALASRHALHRFYSLRPTNEALADTIGGAQFVIDVSDAAAVGALVDVRRTKARTRREVAEELLQAGGANNRPLRATVDLTRYVYIEEAPAAGAEDYSWLRDGSLRGPYGEHVPAYRAPVGIWLDTREALGLLVVAGAGVPTRLFVEEMEYDARRDLLRPRAYGIPGAF